MYDVRRRDNSDSGAVAIVVAVSAVVLFGFAALVVDVGDAQDLKSQTQTALDSAALAAAKQLAADPAADVEDIVENVVDENLADVNPRRIGLSDADHPFALHSAFWKSCVTTVPANFVTSADTPCISWDPAGAVVALRLPEMKVAVTFAGIAGVGSFHVRAASAASATAGAAAYLCEPPDANDIPVAPPHCAASGASPSPSQGSAAP